MRTISGTTAWIVHTTATVVSDTTSWTITVTFSGGQPRTLKAPQGSGSLMTSSDLEELREFARLTLQSLGREIIGETPGRRPEICDFHLTK